MDLDHHPKTDESQAEETSSDLELEEDYHHSSFDNERLKWIAEISESIGKLYTNLNALNRNIESVNLVGRQFENVYNLWSKFEQVISVPPTHDNPGLSNAASPPQHVQTGEVTQKPLGASGLTTSSTSSNMIESSVHLRDPQLPPGVAPGGGMTTWGVHRP